MPSTVPRALALSLARPLCVGSVCLSVRLGALLVLSGLLAFDRHYLPREVGGKWRGGWALAAVYPLCLSAPPGVTILLTVAPGDECSGRCVSSSPTPLPVMGSQTLYRERETVDDGGVPEPRCLG